MEEVSKGAERTLLGRLVLGGSSGFYRLCLALCSGSRGGRSGLLCGGGRSSSGIRGSLALALGSSGSLFLGLSWGLGASLDRRFGDRLDHLGNGSGLVGLRCNGRLLLNGMEW